ncbi:hypothetical protein [Pararhodobacter marinus]|uniref:hypothetical protein n=1 Tax=Pararhodobacter marinus TaxID=2184063 RepID=UPI0035130B26
MTKPPDTRRAPPQDGKSVAPPSHRDPGPSVAAQLRRAIDQGVMRDKVAGDDPAAAPLGTDDEAAGTPPPAALAETEAPPPRPRPRRDRGRVAVIVALLALIAGGLVALGLTGSV